MSKHGITPLTIDGEHFALPRPVFDYIMRLQQFAIPTENYAKRITELKAKGIVESGFKVSGFVLRRGDDEVCIVDMQAVRWFSSKEMFTVMHSSNEKLFGEES